MTKSAHDLSDAIDGWLKQSPKRTLRALSLKSGVAYESLRRYNNGGGDVPFDAAFRVLTAMQDSDALDAYMEAHHPKVHEWAKTYKDVNHSDPTQTYDWDSRLSDRVHYRIFALSTARGGTSRDEIQRLHGEDGLSVLEGLIADGLLTDEGDKVVAKATEYATQSISANQAMVKSAAELFDSRDIDEGTGFMGTHSERVNLKAIEEIKTVLKDAFIKIGQIKNKDEFHGDIPVNACLLLGSLDIAQVKNAKEK